MFRRRRPLLRAAAVGGTAYVAGRHMGRNAEAQQQAESDQDARIDNLEQQQAARSGGPCSGGSSGRGRAIAARSAEPAQCVARAGRAHR